MEMKQKKELLKGSFLFTLAFSQTGLRAADLIRLIRESAHDANLSKCARGAQERSAGKVLVLSDWNSD
jgi:hypothetical protein